VLLTGSTRGPALRENNYSCRAAGWNPVNGKEMVFTAAKEKNIKVNAIILLL
jgi:hypothetical protein